MVLSQDKEKSKTTKVMGLNGEWPMLLMAMVWEMKASLRSMVSERVVLTMLGDVEMHEGWL